MQARIRWDLVTMAVAHGWSRAASGFDVRDHHADIGAEGRLFVIVSPRGDGRLHLDTIRMPEDMGAFDCERLRKLVDYQSRDGLPAFVRSEYFDRTAWYEDGVSCIGHTAIWRLSSRPTIQRDWYVAHGTAMANVWYRGADADHAAADIADCEDMVRSIRFDR